MFIAATKMFFLIVMQTNVAMCNRSMSLGFPPSHLWTFLTLGVETRIEPWDFPPTARRYCDDNVSSLRSFYTLIFSLRTHKDIFWFTDSLSFTLSQVTKLSSPSDALFWAGCPVNCAVFWLCPGPHCAWSNHAVHLLSMVVPSTLEACERCLPSTVNSQAIGKLWFPFSSL